MFRAPSAAEISQSLRSAIRTELPATDPWIWPNTLAIVTKVIAQGLRALYLRLEWVHRQAFASLAEGELLERHGLDIGLTRLPPSVAIGNLTMITTVGTVIPANTRFLRSDDVAFLSSIEVEATTTETTVPVRAEEEGVAGNTDPATPMRLETPISGVGPDTIEVDTDGITGGAEVENDASFRSRILLRKRNPPHGGSPAEYVGWARERSTVTRVYVRRATPQPGSVTVYFMTDDVTANGIPNAGEVSALQSHLEDRAPASAEVIVLAPGPVPVNVTVTNLVPNSIEVQDAVRAELVAMFRRRAEPGTADESFVFSRSWIAEAVAMATGEYRHELTLPAGDVSCGDGEIAVLGTLNFN